MASRSGEQGEAGEKGQRWSSLATANVSHVSSGRERKGFANLIDRNSPASTSRQFVPSNATSFPPRLDPPIISSRSQVLPQALAPLVLCVVVIPVVLPQVVCDRVRVSRCAAACHCE